MKEIIYLIGDATAPEIEGLKIIVYVCNDIGAWGKGFVMAISKRWPEPESQYRKCHRNTIADACTRRLQLDRRNDFLKLVEKWLAGEPGPLKLTLKAHCNTPEHHIIDEFFNKKGGFREKY